MSALGMIDYIIETLKEARLEVLDSIEEAKGAEKTKTRKIIDSSSTKKKAENALSGFLKIMKEVNEAKNIYDKNIAAGMSIEEAEKAFNIVKKKLEDFKKKMSEGQELPNIEILDDKKDSEKEEDSHNQDDNNDKDTDNDESVNLKF